MLLQSKRLTLIASTAHHVRTELETPEKLAQLLDATVSPEWPSGEYDRDAMEFFLARFEEGGESAAGWYGWYALNSDPATGVRRLSGRVAISVRQIQVGQSTCYSILPEWQRRGGQRTCDLLAADAFSSVYQTPDGTYGRGDVASTKVLARCDFHLVGPGRTRERCDSSAIVQEATKPS